MARGQNVGMRILEIRLQISELAVVPTERFYRGTLGLPADRESFRVGHTDVELVPASEGEPFYHFALRVPRNRFTAARDWLDARTPVLAETRFENWNAEACYFHDPAGNIVELIAHHGLPDEGPDGAFAGIELLGVCELGLVGPDTGRMAAALEEVGVGLWDGSLEPGGLAFMGGRDGVLILCPEGRGWMPTERGAEPHPVDAIVAGERAAEAALPGTRHRIRTVPTG
jgi:catechol 2,3-dioxygenase-like lactoylglutathione lyase family enzyme